MHPASVSRAPRRGRKKIITDLIKTFSSVSVREDAGADFVESLGLERPSQVVDPVLLLSKEDWAPLINGKCPEPGKNRLLFPWGIGRFTGKLPIRFQKSSDARS